jgi:hypothetical protein
VQTKAERRERARGTSARDKRVRKTPVVVLRAFIDAEWSDQVFAGASVALAALLLFFAVLAGRDGVDAMRALMFGTKGTVTIASCSENTSSKDPRFWTDGWDCTGSFDGGGLHLRRVRLFMHSEGSPGPAVGARVSGPGADWVWPDGEIEWVFALILAGALPVTAWWLGRFAVDIVQPVMGWPRPAKVVRSGPPKMGDRALRRRRKRVRRH